MKSVVVVGAQWGDEGKGKVVDYLAGAFDYIACPPDSSETERIAWSAIGDRR